MTKDGVQSLRKARKVLEEISETLGVEVRSL